MKECKISTDDLNRLAEIKAELKDLTNEAEEIINNTDIRSIKDSAHCYCIAQLKMAIDDDHGYVGSGVVTLEKIINRLEDFVEEKDEEE